MFLDFGISRFWGVEVSRFRCFDVSIFRDFDGMTSQGRSRQDKTRHDKKAQDKPRQDKIGKDNERQRKSFEISEFRGFRDFCVSRFLDVRRFEIPEAFGMSEFSGFYISTPRCFGFSISRFLDFGEAWFRDFEISRW